MTRPPREPDLMAALERSLGIEPGPAEDCPMYGTGVLMSRRCCQKPRDCEVVALRQDELAGAGLDHPIVRDTARAVERAKSGSGLGLHQLTSHQRIAVDMLRRCAGHDFGWGVITNSATAVYDGQAWVHCRTARLLKEMGIVEFDTTHEDSPMLRLTKGYINA